MDQSTITSFRTWYITRVLVPWTIFAIAVLVGTWFLTTSWLSVVGMGIVLVMIDFLMSRHVAPRLAMWQLNKITERMMDVAANDPR
jgi:hypothetical protein